MSDPRKVLVDLDTLNKLIGAYDGVLGDGHLDDSEQIDTQTLDALRVAIARARAAK